MVHNCIFTCSHSQHYIKPHDVQEDNTQEEVRLHWEQRKGTDRDSHDNSTLHSASLCTYLLAGRTGQKADHKLPVHLLQMCVGYNVHCLHQKGVDVLQEGEERATVTGGTCSDTTTGAGNMVM